MNIPQIQALKRELEVALTQAFADFATHTGLAVEKVKVAEGYLVTVTLERV